MANIGKDKALVSVRIKFSDKGQYAHDFRLNPTKNADPEKSDDNKLLLWNDTVEKTDFTRGAKKSIFQILFKKLRASVKSIFEQKTGKKWRKNSKQYIHGVVSFSETVNKNINLNFAELDACAMEFIEEFSKKYNLRDDAIVYLVRHADEASPHYHFTLLNQDKNGNTLNKRFSPMETSKLQDLAGESFSYMGIKRGIPKAERVAAGDYNVVNQKLDYLRSNLTPEIESKEKQLNSLESAILKRLEQNKTIQANAKKYNQLSKNFKIYLHRAVNAENEEKRKLNAERASKILYKLEQFEGFGEVSISDLAVENQTIETEQTIEEIFNNLERIRAERPELSPKPAPRRSRKKPR
jgi:hypothetical protein